MTTGRINQVTTLGQGAPERSDVAAKPRPQTPRHEPRERGQKQSTRKAQHGGSAPTHGTRGAPRGRGEHSIAPTESSQGHPLTHNRLVTHDSPEWDISGSEEGYTPRTRISSGFRSELPPWNLSRVLARGQQSAVPNAARELPPWASAARK